MDYQGSVYYYDGYSNFMKGKSQFQGENLEANSGARRDWFVGYRHAMADHQCRLNREMDDNVAHQFESSSQQFESLATKQDEEWNGGIPAVSTECEIFDCEKWLPVRIKYVGDYLVVVKELDGSLSERVFHIAKHPDKFRPIRTEAEQKREESVSLIMGWMHHAERAEVELIYDYIAAGKIPHITLK